MLYRVLRPLSTGHEPGQLVDGERFKKLDALIEVNALAPVSFPPLSELPGWKTRAKKLAAENVVTVQDFLDAEEGTLKRIFGHKTTRVISKWKKEVKDWLVVDGPKKK